MFSEETTEDDEARSRQSMVVRSNIRGEVNSFRNFLVVKRHLVDPGILFSGFRCRSPFSSNNHVITDLLTLACSPSRGIGLQTAACQGPRSCANVSRSLQVYPICQVSASSSPPQDFFGRPPFLFPLGFQVNVWCEILLGGFSRGVFSPSPSLLVSSLP